VPLRTQVSRDIRPGIRHLIGLVERQLGQSLGVICFRVEELELVLQIALAEALDEPVCAPGFPVVPTEVRLLTLRQCLATSMVPNNAQPTLVDFWLMQESVDDTGVRPMRLGLALGVVLVGDVLQVPPLARVEGRAESTAPPGADLDDLHHILGVRASDAAVGFPMMLVEVVAVRKCRVALRAGIDLPRLVVFLFMVPPVVLQFESGVARCAPESLRGLGPGRCAGRDGAGLRE